jgi:hypothetical protein
MPKKLLTIALAKKIASNGLPILVTAKVGQTKKPEKVRIVRLNDKTGQMWVRYTGARIPGLYPWNPWKQKKRMGVGSGYDTIYINF